MRIALDCRTIKPWKTGLGRYAYALVRHLAAIDRDNEYLLLTSPLLPQRLIAQENFREIPLAGTPEDVRNVCGHMGILDDERIDIFHALYHFLPRSVRARHTMITCHDLLWINHAHLAFTNVWRRVGITAWGMWAIGRAVRRAAAVICVSQDTRNDVAQRFPTRQALHVIYHGASSLWHTAAPHAEAATLPLPPSPYFLMVGHTKPYKNASGALHALAQLMQRQPQARLVLVGRGDHYHALRRQVAQLQLTTQIHFLPQANDAVLAMLYRHACALLQPSLAESFGLPVLEAMTAGCPVIASSRGGLPEVVGEAGLLLDPTQTAAWANAMEQMMTDAPFRAHCIAQGHIQARKFTWESAARQTLAIYQSFH